MTQLIIELENPKDAKYAVGHHFKQLQVYTNTNVCFFNHNPDYSVMASLSTYEGVLLNSERKINKH